MAKILMALLKKKKQKCSLYLRRNYDFPFASNKTLLNQNDTVVDNFQNILSGLRY